MQCNSNNGQIIRFYLGIGCWVCWKFGRVKNWRGEVSVGVVCTAEQTSGVWGTHGQLTKSQIQMYGLQCNQYYLFFNFLLKLFCASVKSLGTPVITNCCLIEFWHCFIRYLLGNSHSMTDNAWYVPSLMQNVSIMRRTFLILTFSGVFQILELGWS